MAANKQTTARTNALAAKRFVIHVMPATLINGFVLLRGQYLWVVVKMFGLIFISNISIHVHWHLDT